MPHITALHHYPLKGARGLSTNTLAINATTGVEGDRQAAFAKTPTRREAWTAKGLYSAISVPQIASQEPDAIAVGQTLQTALNLTAPPHLLHARNRFNFTYNKGPTVSLLNLATHRLFESFLHGKGKLAPGTPLDPERFRMNLHIEGWPPFAELDLIDTHPGTQKITLGALRFRVNDTCERCKVTHANPATGRYDLRTAPLLTEFMALHRPAYRSPRSHTPCVMGLILTPLTSGVLQVGENLTLNPIL